MRFILLQLFLTSLYSYFVSRSMGNYPGKNVIFYKHQLKVLNYLRWHLMPREGGHLLYISLSPERLYYSFDEEHGEDFTETTIFWTIFKNTHGYNCFPLKIYLWKVVIKRLLISIRFLFSRAGRPGGFVPFYQMNRFRGSNFRMEGKGMSGMRGKEWHKLPGPALTRRGGGVCLALAGGRVTYRPQGNDSFRKVVIYAPVQRNNKTIT